MSHLTLGLSLLVTLIFIGAGITQGLPVARSISANVKRTVRFSTDRQRAKSMTVAEPKVPIIIESHDAQQTFEALHSVSGFLRHDGVNNPIAVRYHDAARGEALTPLQKRLAASIKDLETHGRGSFEPQGRVLTNETESRCFSIGLAGPPDPDCTPIPFCLFGIAKCW